mgnify:CR=1 FL=1
MLPIFFLYVFMVSEFFVQKNRILILNPIIIRKVTLSKTTSDKVNLGDQHQFFDNEFVQLESVISKYSKSNIPKPPSVITPTLKPTRRQSEELENFVQIFGQVKVEPPFERKNLGTVKDILAKNEQEALRQKYQYLERRIRSLENDIENGNDEINRQSGELNRLKFEMTDFHENMDEAKAERAAGILSSAKGKLLPAFILFEKFGS